MHIEDLHGLQKRSSLVHRTSVARRLYLPVLVSALFVTETVRAQVTISLADQFSQTNLYYRAYANHYDPTDISGATAYVVPSGLIGSPGPDQFWDFSFGPKDDVFRFDYLSPEGLAEAADFPSAKIVEQKTVEADGSKQYLFFEPIAHTGRKVYGFYAENPLFTPSNVFVPPIVDFPDPITYGLEWSTSTTYENTLALNDSDPEGGGTFDVAQRVTTTSKFKADAYGTILLPDEIDIFAQGLRINEDVTIDVSADFGDGQFDHIETDYARNYYWMIPGYGIVAQLNSTQSSSPAPDNFPRATAFVRMFETNKKPTTSGDGGCTAPAPVEDMRIRVSSGVILLTWSKADCATQYTVQYSETPAEASSWKPLGDPTPNLVWQGENTQKGPARFYRVVSLK